MRWYPLLTVPMFVFMGYILSESGIANDLYRMFHVWMGGIQGGLAIGTIGLMVLISAMNGLSVAGMAIGATIALPELLRRGYDKRQFVRNSGTAICSVGVIRHDRAPTSGAIMARWRSTRFDDGDDVYYLYRYSLQT